MTVFDTLFTELAEPPLKENFGESVLHEAPDGIQTTLTAIFGEQTNREQTNAEGRVRRRDMLAIVFKSQLAGVVIKHGKITRGGEVWTIDEVEHDHATQLGLALSRSEPAEISGPAFRGSE